jgi:hypothetical protein
VTDDAIATLARAPSVIKLGALSSTPCRFTPSDPTGRSSETPTTDTGTLRGGASLEGAPEENGNGVVEGPNGGDGHGETGRGLTGGHEE